jgi:hypothetical protein
MVFLRLFWTSKILVIVLGVRCTHDHPVQHIDDIPYYSHEAAPYAQDYYEDFRRPEKPQKHHQSVP